MKFFVAFVAVVAVAAARRPTLQQPAILPAFLPADFDHPAVGPVFVEHEQVQPGFGPEIIDFPVNAEGGSPVVIGPVPAGSSPLVQIIVNVAKPVGPVAADAGVGPTLPSIAPEYVQDLPAVGPAIVEDIDEPVSGVIIADLPDSVIVADLPALPVEPVLIGTPQLPPAAVNIPQNLN